MNGFGDSVHERAVMAALIFCAACFPALVALAHNGVAVMLLVMGAVVGSRPEPWRRGVSRFVLRAEASDAVTVLAWSLAGLAAWTALAGLWSPKADASRLALNVAAPILAGGAAIWEIARRPGSQVRVLTKVCAAAAAATVLLMLFEAMTGGAFRALLPPEDLSYERMRDWKELGRGATIMAVTLYPALLLIKRATGRLALSLTLLVAAAIAAAMFGIYANLVGIALGGAAFMLACRWPKSILIAVGAGFLAALLLSPLLALTPAESLVGVGLPLSWEQRLFIWREGARVIFDCMPFGCGPDFARTLRDAVGVVELPGAPAPLSKMPIHPHSLFLQLWFETGLPGVLLFASAILSGALALDRAALSVSEKAAVLAAAAAFLVSALVEMSLWQPWRLAAPMLAGVFVALAVAARSRKVGADFRSGRAEDEQSEATDTEQRP